jgi:hypothetical protein
LLTNPKVTIVSMTWAVAGAQPAGEVRYGVQQYIISLERTAPRYFRRSFSIGERTSSAIRVFFFNLTGSLEAREPGSVFPRVDGGEYMAVSNQPFQLDLDRWKRY